MIAGRLGITLGLRLMQSLLTFAITFAGWILGGAFGLPLGFSGWYALVSRFFPNTYTITLLFPQYYGVTVGEPITTVFTQTSRVCGIFIEK